MSFGAASDWLLPRAAAADPHGAAARRLRRLLGELVDPWTLPSERLPHLTRLALAASWGAEAGVAAPAAAVLAARQRHHDALDWAAERGQLSSAEQRLLHGVSRLQPDEVDLAWPEALVIRRALGVLDLLRRYGPEEEDIHRRLAQAVGELAARHGAGAFVVAQLNEVAAWAALLRGSRQAAARLSERSPLVAAGWVGSLALGGDPAVARHRAAAAAAQQARLAVAQRLVKSSSREPEAVAWWRAEATGWSLAAAGVSDPPRLRAAVPAVLSGG